MACHITAFIKWVLLSKIFHNPKITRLLHLCSNKKSHIIHTIINYSFQKLFLIHTFRMNTVCNSQGFCTFGIKCVNSNCYLYKRIKQLSKWNRNLRQHKEKWTKNFPNLISLPTVDTHFFCHHQIPTPILMNPPRIKCLQNTKPHIPL